MSDNLISLEEAARELLRAQCNDQRTVGYRLDLWMALQACLEDGQESNLPAAANETAASAPQPSGDEHYDRELALSREVAEAWAMVRRLEAEWLRARNSMAASTYSGRSRTDEAFTAFRDAHAKALALNHTFAGMRRAWR